MAAEISSPDAERFGPIIQASGATKGSACIESRHEVAY